MFILHFNTKKPVIFILCCALFQMLPHTAWSSADGLRITLYDQNGQLIQNAVIALPDVLVDSSDQNTQHAIMDQRDRKFVPHVLAIKPNTYISFPNSDNIRHHVYSFSEAKRFEIKLYADKPEAPVFFDQPGLVVLGCNIHDSMVGHVFVSQWEYFAKSDSEGVVNIDYSGVLPQELLVWHPRLIDGSKPMSFKNIQWRDRNAVINLDLKKPLSKKKSRFR